MLHFNPVPTDQEGCGFGKLLLYVQKGCGVT